MPHVRMYPGRVHALLRLNRNCAVAKWLSWDTTNISPNDSATSAFAIAINATGAVVALGEVQHLAKRGGDTLHRWIIETGERAFDEAAVVDCADLVDGLRFVFRNFPLSEVHPHAEHAAEIAEAAGTHHKFWEMHDLLYAHQQALDDQHLAEYASSLGVPAPEVARALAQHAYLERVREDFMSGVRSGVKGTPTFFINAVRHDGA